MNMFVCLFQKWFLWWIIYPLKKDWQGNNTPSRTGIIIFLKEKKIQVLASMWRNWNAYMLLMGIKNDAAALECLMILQKVKQNSIWPSNMLPLGIWPTKIENRCLNKHAHRNTIHNSQEVKPKYPSTVEWINKVRWILTIDYSSIERNVPTHNIMQSEECKTEKIVYCMIPFIWDVQNRQIHRDKADQRLAGPEGGRNGGMTA